MTHPRQTGKTGSTVRGFNMDGYTDENDVSWDSVSEWFFCEVLGGCGCGTSDEIAEHAWTVFTLIAAKKNQVLIKEHNNNYTETTSPQSFSSECT